MNLPKCSEHIRLKQLLSGIEGTLCLQRSLLINSTLWVLEQQCPWVAGMTFSMTSSIVIMSSSDYDPDSIKKDKI